MKIFRDTFEQSVKLPQGMWETIRRLLFGRPKDPYDPNVTHKMTLIALLAWVGLGADGLSSSAYGPAEAFTSLVGSGGNHTYLAIFIALATAATVFIISYTYSRIIEHFPAGGGGYVVATALLGNSAGVVSGCALLVDYVLTITVSVASGGNAVFSLIPPEWTLFGLPIRDYKMPLELATIGLLLLMNLRGVKESVSMLVPIFLIFLVTHAILIVGTILFHVPHAKTTAAEMNQQFQNDLSTIGWFAILHIFFRAYSMGAGTYTGIEAVSNGLSIMREPRVITGKRTMAFMATSLALTAGGLLLCYALADVRPDENGYKTLNTVLVQAFAGDWTLWGLPVGVWFVFITIASEAVLLLVAAQAGFIDGPRVMSNMATDDWLPRKFAALSERLVMQNGIVLMALSAAALLLITYGNIQTLVIMYSINVFVTFSLSQLGMMRFWVRDRAHYPRVWLRHLIIHGIGLALCGSILVLMIYEKFTHGAWLTLVITGSFIGLCVVIRQHYMTIAAAVRKTDRIFANIAKVAKPNAPVLSFDNDESTAVLLVKGYNGLGIHSLLSIFRLFPSAFKQVVFVSVGVVDSGLFKGSDQIKHLEETTRQSLERYVQLANSLGIPARSQYVIGTDVVGEASELCVDVSQQCPRVTFFAGEVLFGRPHWWDKFLHNDIAYAIQRRIRFVGLSMVILPMLVQQFTADPAAAGSTPLNRGSTSQPQSNEQKPPTPPTEPPAH
jgi:amino acid transporter